MIEDRPHSRHPGNDTFYPPTTLVITPILILLTLFPGDIEDATGELKSPDSAIRIEAINHLATFGKKARKATPEIVQLLADKNQLVSEAAEEALVTIGLGSIKALESVLESAPHAAGSARSLLRLGKRGRKALDEHLDVAESSEALASICAEVGNETLATMLACMEVQAARRACLRGLCRFDQVEQLPADTSLESAWLDSVRWALQIAEPSNAELLTALRNADAAMRELAAHVLSIRSEKPTQELIDVLVETLGKDDRFVRKNCIRAVHHLGRAAESAVPHLVAIVNADDPVLSAPALEALVKCAGKNDQVLAPLLDKLAAQFLEGKSKLGSSLGSLGAKSLPTFEAGLDSADRAVVLASIRNLKSLNLPTASALERLKPLSESEDATIRKAAAGALHVLESASELQVLRSKLHSELRRDRAKAAEALSRLKQDGTKAIDDLIVLLEDPEWEVRSAATLGLMRLGEPAKRALIDLVSDQDRGLLAANALLESFGNHGYDALVKAVRGLPLDNHTVSLMPLMYGGAFTPLIDAVNEPSVRASALRQLRRLSHSWPGSRTDWPIESVADNDWRMTTTWALAIESVSLPTLLEGLESEHSAIRETAAFKIGQGLSDGFELDTQMLAALTDGLTDPDNAVRRTCAWAIRSGLRSGPDRSLLIPGAGDDYVLFPSSVEPGIGADTRGRSVWPTLWRYPQGKVSDYHDWSDAALWTYGPETLEPEFKSTASDIELEFAIQGLMELLPRAATEEERMTSMCAANTLGSLGAKCMSQADALRELLKSPITANVAAHALSTSGPAGAPLLQDLIQSLELIELPRQTISTIEQMRTPESEAALVQLVLHERMEIATWAVGVVGGRKEFSAELQNALGQAFLNGADVAAAPLTRMGSFGVDIFSQALALEGRVAVSAFGLRELGPHAVSAVQLLKKARSGASQLEKNAIRMAIRAIEKE